MEDKELTSELSPAELKQEVEKLAEQEVQDPTLTQVTTLAEEEKKAPEAPKLTKQDMREMALRDHMGGLLQLQNLVRRMSKRGLSRIFTAILQLPQEGLKVNLNGPEEQAVFGIAQRVLNAKFALILHYVEEESLKLKQAQKEEENKNERKSTSDTVNSDSIGSSPSEPDPDRSSVEENVEEKPADVSVSSSGGGQGS